MNVVRLWNCLIGRLGWLMLAALWWPALSANAALEEHFDVLQIGTRTYKNVTVTTKAKDYIFIFHSAGLTNIKVKDLPSELLGQLGYAPRPAGEAKPATSWLKNATGALGKQQLPQLEQRLRGLGGERSARLAAVSARGWWSILAVMLLFYLALCYCFRAICLKAGHPPGVLIWLPVLQRLPLLRAAGMSGWWFLAYLVPVLNLVAYVVWSFKILQAREKGTWLVLFLLLPGTNLLVLLYLAFSSAASRKEAPVVEIMTLDAA